MVDVGLGSGSRATWRPGTGSWSPPTAQGESHPSWVPGSPMARPGLPGGLQWVNLFQTASNAL